LGGNLSYTVAVSNLGPAAASGVIVTDTLPANVTFVSASGGASNSGGVVVGQMGSISAGTGTNLTIVVTPLATGLFTNTAVLSATTSDPSSANNSTVQIAAVMVPPLLTNPNPGGGFSLSLSSMSGVKYQLEYKNVLTDPTWTALPPPISGTGGVIVLNDTNAPSISTRFYRVSCLNGL
jgi:uncharacterized repeat protein (TIGR01451 family)